MNLRQLVFSNTLSKNCWSKHLGQLFIVTSLSAAFPLWHPKKSQKKTSRNPPSSRAGIPYPLRKRERVPWLKKIGEKFPVPQKKRQRKLFQPSDFLFFFQWRLYVTRHHGVFDLFGEMVHLHWLATEHLLWSIGRRPPSITGDLQAEHPDIQKVTPIPEFRFSWF